MMNDIKMITYVYVNVMKHHKTEQDATDDSNRVIYSILYYLNKTFV